MAKKRILQFLNKRNQNVEVFTTHVPLCALGTVILDKKLFSPIHELVKIDQKRVDYCPTDKLVFVTLGLMAGAETVSDINHTLRPNQPLLVAFGYPKCADQSVIQQTLSAATEINVLQLEQAIKQIWNQNNQLQLLQKPDDTKLVTMDIDLSALPISKRAEGASKGYVPNRKNQYTRQLGRVLLPQTQEVVTQSLYTGNTVSCCVLKEMVVKMEEALDLTTQEQRQPIRLRLDAGFGTDDNLNFLLWRDYQIIAKIYSTKRAKNLATSVPEWVPVPSQANNTQRQAGWVTKPHRYCRKTVQVAIRTLTDKGEYAYSILVTTSLKATLFEIVTDYDGRSGVPESTFCQDYQGLFVRKRRKGGFVAQQMLLLLSQLAHNLLVWMKSWLIDALGESLLGGEGEPDRQTLSEKELAQRTLKERGIKRFSRHILSLKGKVIFKGQKVVGIILNPLYPLIHRIKTALEAFLKPYKIWVSLDES